MSDMQTNILAQGSVNNFYELGDSKAETITATLYKAVDRETANPALVWVNKYHFDIENNEPEIFLNRVKLIDGITPPLSSMNVFAVDNEGYAFASFPPSLRSLNEAGSPDFDEQQRRFFKIVNLVNCLHTSKIVCGDISINSFFLNRSGNIEFSGLLGLHPEIFNLAIDIVDNKLLSFCAPEILTNASLDLRSDVFSLGVVGFNLLTGALPYEVIVEEGQIDYQFNPEVFESKQIPESILSVLKVATSLEPNERYESASGMLHALLNAREETQDEHLPVVQETKSTHQNKSTSQITTLKPIRQTNTNIEPIEETEPDKFAKLLTPKFALSVIGVLLACLVILWFVLTGRQSEKNAKAIQQASEPFSAGNPRLQDAIDTLSDLNVEDQQKVAEIEKLVNSSDPLTHRLLLVNIKETKVEGIRLAAQKALFKRVEKNGLKRSSEQAKEWVRYSKLKPSDETFQKVLKIIDPVAPDQERVKLLKQVAKKDLNITVRLAASLFFDQKLNDTYHEVLVESVGGKLGFKNPGDLSSLALITLHDGLAQIFSSDIGEHVSTFTDKDMLNLLIPLSKRNDSYLAEFIKIAAKRDLFSKAHNSFLQMIASNPDLRPHIIEVLVAASFGELTKVDLESLSGWPDPQVEKIFFAIMATSEDSSIRKTALDIVAARNPATQPGAKIVSFAKDKFWKERDKYAQAMGVLAVSQFYSKAEIRKALKLFDRYIEKSKFLEILLTSSDPKITEMILKEFPDKISIHEKLNLLNHPDVEVRKAVIPTIDSNDLGVLKLLIEKFDSEKDESVKKLYRKHVWTLRDRR